MRAKARPPSRAVTSQADNPTRSRAHQYIPVSRAPEIAAGSRCYRWCSSPFKNKKKQNLRRVDSLGICFRFFTTKLVSPSLSKRYAVTILRSQSLGRFDCREGKKKNVVSRSPGACRTRRSDRSHDCHVRRLVPGERPTSDCALSQQRLCRVCVCVCFFRVCAVCLPTITLFLS